jgi:predicted ATP-dependent protease
VTGSVNQNGEVQAIGGVNEKIEGFFDCCKRLGPSKNQGVMIPASNVKDLMLRPDLVEAVKKGNFHVYAVKTIDEGIEILTGKKAGVKTATGRYTRGSINYLVDEKFKTLALGLKNFGNDKKKKGAKKTAKKGSTGTGKKKTA